MRDRAYPWAMRDTPEFLVHCATADEADRALGLGFAIETTPRVLALTLIRENLQIAISPGG